eukprot:4138378-Amphidinium_carterae.1
MHRRSPARVVAQRFLATPCCSLAVAAPYRLVCVYSHGGLFVAFVKDEAVVHSSRFHTNVRNEGDHLTIFTSILGL